MPKKIKEKKCSVCQVIVKPPLQWWDSVNACSDCVRKAALDIQREKKIKPFFCVYCDKEVPCNCHKKFHNKSKRIPNQISFETAQETLEEIKKRINQIIT